MSDLRMQRGQQWLETLLQLTGVPAAVKAEWEKVPANGGERHEEADSFWLTIDAANLTPTQIQILTGSEGTVLDAIQYLTNASLNLSQTHEQQASYTVELDGYRVRRQAEIQELAKNAAQMVRTTGKEVEIKSLSSAERRQVHTFLKDFTDLETFSRGKEPHRHLVIRQSQSG
ncbi:MAG: RNA-binding protein [Chroococcidiopsidaceae cyanobacterium CP_BM_RX_35]|nr:RNA-binding protein [Chroococcidiopsidaceae cyanobacterium CP_BM_RX_35]